MAVQFNIKRILKGGMYGLAYGITLLAIAYFVLQLPSVQKALLDRYLSKFNRVTNFDISTRLLHLYWYDRLEVRGLEILDPEKNQMIYIDDFRVNFQIAQLSENSEVNIDGVSLDSVAVNLRFIKETGTTKDININEWINALNKMFEAKPDTTLAASPKGFKLNIGEIVLNNAAFSFHNADKDSISDGFDHNHFRVRVYDSEINAFKIIGDSVQFNVLSLVGKEIENNWPIHDISTFYRVSQAGMEFYNLKIKMGKSYFSDTLIFKYKSPGDMADFVEKVNVKAKIKNAVLHPDDLRFFASTAPKFLSPIQLSGQFSGRVNHFYLDEMDLQMGTSRVLGKIEMDGLPSIRETFINLSVYNSPININDWEFALPPFAFNKLKPLKNFNLSGDYIGFFNDFVADGKINSAIGEIDSDINMKIDETNLERSSYTGNLTLNDFHLGEYLEDTITYQRLTMNGNVSGNGLTQLTADFMMKGTISSIGLLHYNYSNIESNARFTKNFFNGSLMVDDQNLKCSVIGSVDFRNKADLINMTAKIDTANLNKLKLIPQDFSFRTDIAINSEGLSIDSIRGTAKLFNVGLRYKENSLSLDSIDIVSHVKGPHRSLLMNSSFGTLDVHGDFYYSTLFHDFQNIFHEFYLNMKNDKVALAEYYSKKEPWDQEYKADFKANLKNINPVLNFLKLDMEVSKNITIDGDFTNGYTSIFHAYSAIKALRITDKYFYDSDIEFNGSKIHDTTSVLALVTLNSKRQVINKNISTKDLLFEAIWNRDHIDVGFDIDQQDYDNTMRLKAEVDFLTDSTRIKMLPSSIKALGKLWEVNPQNLVMFVGNEWSVKHFSINHEQESAMLDGDISDDPSKAIRIMVKNVGIGLVNSLTEEKFTGTLNADFTLKNLYGNVTFQNEFSVDKLTINNFLVGDVSGSTAWDAEQDAFIINFFVDRLQNRIVDITGLYDPANKSQSLNLTARLNKTNLKIVEPVMRGLFSNWAGTATGKFDISGTLATPNISGSAQIDDGKLTVDYLKTTYGVTGKFGMNHNQIELENLQLTDALGNKGELNGVIANKNFDAFRISLDAHFKNFQLLNTTAKDNNLFYGQAYGTGSLNILGPFDNLKVSATARTEKNTRLFIPVSGSTEVAKTDFISFVSFKDTARHKEQDELISKRESSNFSVALNLDITPDAYSEIIFDIKAGDIIRGYGKGDIKLEVDTKGEFNMFGLYEFEKGFYNFTLGGIINKEFTINSGSSINWYGDPYTGVVNINASYRQLASIAPILTDPTLAQAPQLRRKFPIEVLLKLDGPMLGPQISFDLNAKDLPTSIAIEGRSTPVRPSFEFNAFKAKLDEQELKKQVFSLIVLRKFSTPDAFTTGSSIANSVSEFLSNQLSYWLSQVDQNLEVNLDLGTMDNESFNTFQLRMSYTFLNGRLRITRDGSLGSNQFAQSEVASIAGDWTVDYLLTSDGKFKAKMYSRSNYNSLLNSLGGQAAVTTGLSLSHTQSFNQFADLLRFNRKKRQQELLTTPEPAGDDESEN